MPTASRMPPSRVPGDAATLLPKYIAVGFEEDQAGYLAGIVAASISQDRQRGGHRRHQRLRARACATSRAMSSAPSRSTPTSRSTPRTSSTDFSNTAFNDPTAGNNFAQQFLAQYPDTDVMFQVAGKTGNGVLQAACTAKINGIGVDVDQYLSLNAASDPTYGCLVTSAEKHLQSAVSQIDPGDRRRHAPRVATPASTPPTMASACPTSIRPASMITPEIQTALDAAMAAMKAGTLTTCPENCGTAN